MPKRRCLIVKILVLFVFVAILYLNRAYAALYAGIARVNLPNRVVRELTVTPASSFVSSTPLILVAFGDSLTAGVGADDFRDSYSYRLAESLAEAAARPIELHTLAIPGATTADVITHELPELANFHPDMSTLLIGENDIHDRVSKKVFEKNLRFILTYLIKYSTHVNILTIPELGSTGLFLPPYHTYFAYQTRQYNAVLTNVAMQFPSVQVIDLHGLTNILEKTDPSYYSRDGFHPSAWAYRAWAPLIYAHLNY